MHTESNNIFFEQVYTVYALRNSVRGFTCAGMDGT
jgi:hypothetical protein